MGEGIKLDKLDRALVAELQEDGRIGNRSLAQKLDVTEITIANRLKRLEQNSVLRVVAITNMLKFQFSELAFAMIRVAGRPPPEIAAELAQVPESLAVTMSTGRFDMVVALLARDRQHLAELIGSTLNKVKGVEEVRAQLALEVYKYESKWASLVAEHPPLPVVEPCESADELDIEVIRLLQVDARTSNRRIATELDVSEGTIRSRVKRMVDEKVIRIQALSDVEAFGYFAHAYVGIQGDGSPIGELAERLSQDTNIAVLTHTIGSFDLLAVVYTTDHFSLVDTILNRISVTPGVKRTETLESFGTTKHCYTWGFLS